MVRIVDSSQAISLIRDGDAVLIGGSGGGHAVPELLIDALEARFLRDGSPRDLTLIFPVGLGDEQTLGVNKLAHEGLLKTAITSTFVDCPMIAEMASAGSINSYTMPLGVLSQLLRAIAGGRPGLITEVGKGTFIDPRLDGGQQSGDSSERLVELIEIDGKDWLRYRPFHIDVAFIRGTTADEAGNITMEREAVFADMLAMAQAARNQGALVVAQVERLAERATLPPKDVKVPGMLVDLLVVDEQQRQTYATAYSPAYAGEIQVPAASLPPLALNVRKVIARRAVQELFSGAVCNLGFGVSNGIANVAAEENLLDAVVLTNEQGLIGGAPASGTDAGASTRYASMIDMASQFDFYDGGGLDLAFLSFAEADVGGNVNVSRFGGRIGGVGGFVNISQGARKVVFSGTLTGGGLEAEIAGGSVKIRTEGRFRKFVSQLEQLCYSSQLAQERGQEAIFVTERAVFRLGDDQQLELVEIAPGLDAERDVLRLMEFTPSISSDLIEMDARIFDPAPMGLKGLSQAAFPSGRSERLEELDHRSEDADA